MRRGALPRSLSQHTPTNAARSQRHICCYNHLFTRSRHEDESGSCPYPPTPEPPGPPSPVLLHLDGSGAAAETACDLTCAPQDGRLHCIRSDKIKISILGKIHLCFSNTTSGSKVRQTRSKGSFCVHCRLNTSFPGSATLTRPAGSSAPSDAASQPRMRHTYPKLTPQIRQMTGPLTAERVQVLNKTHFLSHSQKIRPGESRPATHTCVPQRARLRLSVTQPVPSPSIPSAVPARHIRHNPEKRQLH